MKNKILKYSLAILLILLSLYAIYAFNRFTYLIKINLNSNETSKDPLSYSYIINPTSLLYVFVVFFSLIYIWTNKKIYLYLNVILSINTLLFVFSYQPEFSQVNSFIGEIIHILLVNILLIVLSVLNVFIYKITNGKSLLLNKNENIMFLISSILLCFSGFYLYGWSFPASAESFENYPLFVISIPIMIGVIALISVLNLVFTRKDPIIIKVKHNKVEILVLLSLLYVYLFNISVPIYPQITIFYEALIAAILLLIYDLDIFINGSKRNNFVFTLFTLFLELMLIIKTVTFSFFASQDFNVSGSESSILEPQEIIFLVAICFAALLEIVSELFVAIHCFKEIYKNKEIAQLNNNNNLSVLGIFLFLCYCSSFLFYLGRGIESSSSIYVPFMHLWSPYISLSEVTSIPMKAFYILTQPSLAILLAIVIEAIVLLLLNNRLKKKEQASLS